MHLDFHISENGCEIEWKIGTRSVHVGIRKKISKLSYFRVCNAIFNTLFSAIVFSPLSNLPFGESIVSNTFPPSKIPKWYVKACSYYFAGYTPTMGQHKEILQKPMNGTWYQKYPIFHFKPTKLTFGSVVQLSSMRYFRKSLILLLKIIPSMWNRKTIMYGFLKISCM